MRKADFLQYTPLVKCYTKIKNRVDLWYKQEYPLILKEILKEAKEKNIQLPEQLPEPNLSNIRRKTYYKLLKRRIHKRLHKFQQRFNQLFNVKRLYKKKKKIAKIFSIFKK